MKVKVISLSRRLDRRERFTASHKDFSFEFFNAVKGSSLLYTDLAQMGITPSYKWRDPILKRRLTRGEVGCALSHIALWQECVDTQENYLILEDDVALQRLPTMERLEQLATVHGFVYLTYREMGAPAQFANNFVIPDYPYWAAAYVISPRCAEFLLAAQPKTNLIPVDEFLPVQLKRWNADASHGPALAFDPPIATQISRSVLGSDIEPTSEEDYVRTGNVHFVTVATDEDKAKLLLESGRKFGAYAHILGRDTSWRGTNMSGPGGGQKIRLMQEYLTTLPDNDIVLFSDGYDSFITDALDDIVGRYLGFGAAIVCSAESTCWPDPALEPQYAHVAGYRFLNSGGYIGEVWALKKLFADSIADADDDQLYMAKQYLSGRHDMVLDHEAYIFQTHEPQVYTRGVQLVNPVTHCCPIVYHGNGGADAKQNLNKLYNEVFGQKIAFHTPAYYKISDEMLVVPFMTKEQCRELIEIAEARGDWQSLSYDKFPAMEIRTSLLSQRWHQSFEEHWNGPLKEIIEEYWHPIMMYGLRDSFVMRYTMDTQRNLALHHDASLVTGSVKLNDDYEGAELVFPRQKVGNKDIPVGHMILFPGQVTHGHRCEDLQSGVKYSLTFWTKQHTNDEA